MYISRSFNKRMNVWYAYEVDYVWDEFKQKKVQKRRCIGKFDPETDQVIPNGKRGHPRFVPSPNGSADANQGANQPKPNKPKKSYITMETP